MFAVDLSDCLYVEVSRHDKCHGNLQLDDSFIFVEMLCWIPLVTEFKVSNPTEVRLVIMIAEALAYAEGFGISEAREYRDLLKGGLHFWLLPILYAEKSVW